MNEQLILKYQNNFARLIQDEYCLGDKMYNFEDHEDLDDFDYGTIIIKEVVSWLK